MVTVEFIRDGRRKQMQERFAKIFVKSGAAKIVETREIRAEEPAPVMPDPVEQPAIIDSVDEETEISPRTGKPKRKYRRRDMKVED